MASRELEDNAYPKFWTDNKEYYGIFEKGFHLFLSFDANFSSFSLAERPQNVPCK